MMFEMLEFTELICACLTCALRIVVKDMGNGVDRVESSDQLPIGDAREEGELPGRYPLPLPCPDRLRDICACASIDAGRITDCPRCVPSGSVRSIDDHTLEMIVWRRE